MWLFPVPIFLHFKFVPSVLGFFLCLKTLPGIEDRFANRYYGKGKISALGYSYEYSY